MIGNRRKILIANNELHIGGIQKSLVNLLEEIKDKYDVTLFLAADSGDAGFSVPDNVRIVYGNLFTRILGLNQSEARKTGLFCWIWRSFWVIISRIFGAGMAFRFLSRLQRIDGEYDAAVSYMHNSGKNIFYGGINEIVLKSVRAKQKITFIHCDFKNYEGNNAYNRNLYRNFDKVACVSESVKERFLEVMPDMRGKAYCVHNCYDFRQMALMAEKEDAPYTKDKVNIFTAARLSSEKGILRMIPILAEIKKSGEGFIWRVAGDGAGFSAVAEMIKKYEIDDRIILLGEKDNPYPYFKAADIVLVPSYHEAAPMVFGEAEFFGVPIFTTDTTSAKELVADKAIGWVVANDDDAIKEKLHDIIRNKAQIKHHKSNMSNDKAVSEFDNLVGENMNL